MRKKEHVSGIIIIFLLRLNGQLVSRILILSEKEREGERKRGRKKRGRLKKTVERIRSENNNWE